MKAMMRSTSAMVSRPMPSPGRRRSLWVVIGRVRKSERVPTRPSAPAAAGQAIACSPRRASAEKGNGDEQGEAVQGEKGAKHAHDAAGPKQGRAAGDDGDTAEHDRDLQLRLGIA